MKKIIYAIGLFGTLSFTACGDPDELTPRQETFNDKVITLPAPPRLSDSERDIISRQRQEWADFVAGGGIQEPESETENNNK